MIQFEIINCGMKIFDVIGDGVENVHLVPILAFGSLSAVCTRLRAFNCLPEGELSSSVCAFHQELRLGLEIRESGLSGAPVLSLLVLPSARLRDYLNRGFQAWI